MTTTTSPHPGGAPAAPRAGTPIWVDLSTPDVEGAQRFYGHVFDWTADALGPEAGGYKMLRSKGRMVAGLGPVQSPQQPAAWLTYVATDDADASAEKVRAAGGQVVMPPMDVMEAGRMALFMDPTGAMFGVWQSGAHRGAEVFNEPTSLAWNELSTRDLESATGFYPRVFGWGVKANGSGENAYVEWQLEGRSIGGAMSMPAAVPAQVPPHWLAYFAVDDTDATLARATEAGGEVVVPPMDMEPGRFAVLRDPQGASFGVIALRRRA